MSNCVLLIMFHDLLLAKVMFSQKFLFFSFFLPPFPSLSPNPLIIGNTKYNIQACQKPYPTHVESVFFNIPTFHDSYWKSLCERDVAPSSDIDYMPWDCEHIVLKMVSSILENEANMCALLIKNEWMKEWAF